MRLDRYSYHFYEYRYLKAGLLSKSDSLILIDISHEREDFINLIKMNYAPSSEDRIPFLSLIEELSQYMDGKRREFSIGYTLTGTPFQREVWKRVSQIPFGLVKSYREIAFEVNSPRAFRAVGNALANNKLPIIIPCHRVISTGGKLGGFGGGIELKKMLLTHEGVTLNHDKVIL